MWEWFEIKTWDYDVSVQCRRKPGHGPGGLYCKQHAKTVEKAMKG